MKLKRLFILLIISILTINLGCSIARNGLKYAAKSTLKRSLAKVTKYSGKYGKYVFGRTGKYWSTPTKEIKNLSKDINQRYITKAKDQFIKKKREEVSRLFNGKISPLSLQQLQKDAIKNPALLKELQRNPSALKVYENALGTAYREDITFLRYWANNADKFYDKRLKQVVKGEDIVFQKGRGVTEITDRYGNKLGKFIKGNGDEHYVIDITNAQKNTLANFYPMSNAKYIRGNQTYITDRYGRVIECRVKIDKSVQKFGRDEYLTSKIRDSKYQYGVDGTLLRTTKVPDDGGHLIADSWNGRCDFLNIVPQEREINRAGSIWNKSESHGLKSAQSGNIVERIIKLKYPDNKSLRPNLFILEQKVNGNPMVIDGTTMVNVLLENN